MATTEKYTTVIELNSEQAVRQLEELKRKVESWKQLKDEAIKAKESKSFVAQINRELGGLDHVSELIGDAVD